MSQLNKNSNERLADAQRLSNLFNEVKDIRYGRAFILCRQWPSKCGSGCPVQDGSHPASVRAGIPAPDSGRSSCKYLLPLVPWLSSAGGNTPFLYYQL